MMSLSPEETLDFKSCHSGRSFIQHAKELLNLFGYVKSTV
jgi:hypothetical protein